jgi:hypothetical protein
MHPSNTALKSNISLLIQRPGFQVVVMLLLILVVGFLVDPQYGMSIDEPTRLHFAELSLKAYHGGTTNLTDEKGAFFGMIARLGGSLLSHIVTSWKLIDGWHFMSFLAFGMGLYFFYRLCRRLVSHTPALFATLLFGTQPVLWGHAFINPKDIPFMAFFIASVSLGLDMVDQKRANQDAASQPHSIVKHITGLWNRLKLDWGASERSLRRGWNLLVLLLLALFISLGPVKSGIAWVIRFAYASGMSNWIGRFFLRLAAHSDQIPVEAYILKSQALYLRVAILAGLGLLIAIILITRNIFPSAVKRWKGALPNPRLLLAGIFLGFCSAIRTLGPAAGLLVVTYYLFKCGRKAISTSLAYLGISALVTYLSWPYLWGSPINHYLYAITQASDYPWYGIYLFNGVLYPGNIQPPVGYFPVLFGLQFTEPAVVLILGGIVLALVYIFRNRSLRLDMLLLGVWFSAPIAATLVMHSTVYNNFRQFLFITPPLFILVGLVFQSLWEKLKRRTAFFIVIAMLCLLPGIYSDIQLHPYQYIYYNSLTAGLKGAVGRYEMDYWLVTYKEAIEYINRVAPENSRVAVNRLIVTTQPYVRPDLKLFALAFDKDPGYPADTPTDYAIISVRSISDLELYPDSPVVYEIRRDGVVLTVVKQVQKGALILEP